LNPFLSLTDKAFAMQFLGYSGWLQVVAMGVAMEFGVVLNK